MYMTRSEQASPKTDAASGAALLFALTTPIWLLITILSTWFA